MQNQRILVTGASGFIGGHICDFLHQSGYNVVGWGRRNTPPSWWNPNIPYHSIDLRLELPMLSGYHSVIHTAGLADDRSSFRDLMDINVSGTARLVRAIPGDCGLIFISSASVYPLDSEVHREDRSISPDEDLSHYGRSKLMAEQLLLLESHRCAYLTMLRPRAVYGPRDLTLLPRLSGLLKGNTIYFPGDGMAQISLTHVYNLCEAVRLSLEKKTNDIFNIADSRTYIMKEVLLDALNTGTPLQWKSLPLTLFRKIADVSKWVGLRWTINHQSLDYLNKSMTLDISLANRKLGYKPPFELADFLNRRDHLIPDRRGKKIISARDIEKLHIRLID